jgi:hypothetical protein
MPNKVTRYECYHDTPEQAKAWIIAEAQKEVESAQRKLDYANKKLEAARNAKLPNVAR